MQQAIEFRRRRHRPGAWRPGVIAVVMIAGGPLPWALGQDTEFARLKAATNLSADHIQTIQRWVQQQLPDLLNAEDAREARQAAKVFTDAYTGGTAVFQAAFLEQCAQAFLAPLSQPDTEPQAVLMMSMFLARQATAPIETPTLPSFPPRLMVRLLIASHNRSAKLLRAVSPVSRTTMQNSSPP